MVTHTPGHFGGSFETLEMWLQRKAVLRVYEQFGIQAFLPFDKHIRLSLVYYLLITHQLDAEARKQLKEAIIKSDKYTPERDWSWEKKRRLVYMAPLEFIMEQLQAEQ